MMNEKINHIKTSLDLNARARTHGADKQLKGILLQLTDDS